MHNLLDSIFQMLAKIPESEIGFKNLIDFKTAINNSKKVIIERGTREIREIYRLTHEKEFKNKYFL